MDRQIVIPVVRHVQKGVTCYTGYMAARESRLVTFADHYPPKPDEGRIGYQRVPNAKRAKAFAEYLMHTESGFMTPILLNSREPVHFVPMDGSREVGEIHVPAGQRFAKVDGQHRGMGVEEYLNLPDFPVPFMLFEKLPAEMEQQLFVAINREQKRVAMSHVLWVKEEVGAGDELTTIAMQLNEDDRSPWHRRVNLIGATGTGLAVTLQTLQEGLGDLFASGKLKVLGYDAKYEVARAYWQVVAETWPDAWAAPKQHLITKAVGLFGLSKTGSFVVADCLTGADDVIDIKKLRTLLGKAKAVDWSSKGQFQGLGGRGGADIVSDTLDAYLFGGPIA